MARSAAMAALLMLALLAVPAASADTGGHGQPAAHTVTMTLQEYTDLYKEAHLQEARRSVDGEREDLRQAFERKKAGLESERARLAGLAARKSTRERVIPGNWLLLNHSAAGVFRLGENEHEEQSMAVFDFAIDFRIFDDAWTAIPLVDGRAIASGWKVLKQESVCDGNGNGSALSEFRPVDLGPEMLLVLRPVEGDKRSKDEAEAEGPAQKHMLVTNHSGHYRILFQAYARVQSVRSLHKLTLALEYPLSQTTLRLQRGPGSASRSMIKELSTEPMAFHELAEQDDHVDVRLRLPSTKVFSLKWRTSAPTAASAASATSGGKPKARKIGVTASSSANATTSVEASPEEEPEARASVVHDVLHSIDEGVVRSESSFKFIMDTEQSLSSAEIVIPGAARVTGVVAHGMQTWRALPISNISLPSDSPETSPRNGTVVQVTFKSSAMSKEAIVMLSTELELDPERARVDLPAMVCKDVLRQTGTISVIKVASVEVYEHSARGVARAGVGQVPAHVRSRTDQPIVLAYKYLSPRHAVILSLMHHEEIQTLSSVVDSALYQVLVVDAQKMQSLTLVLQNSQQQYMAVRDIPEAATVWSLRVNSLSTQPVRGRDGTLMVPLLVGKGGDSNDGGAASKTSVELAWMTEHSSLGANGSLNLSPPRVDMPVSAMSVEVQLPEIYEVNFTSTLQNVSIFSHKQPHAVNYQTEKHDVEQGFKFGTPPKPAEPKASVKAKIPRQGRRFRFEKILVVGDNAVLSAAYALDRSREEQQQQPWWHGVTQQLR